MDRSDLKKLSRLDLIELLLEQTRRTEQLEAELAETKDRLKNREISLTHAGSIAEAALEINRVFEAADAAARQYKDSVMLQYRQKAENDYRQWLEKFKQSQKDSFAYVSGRDRGTSRNTDSDGRQPSARAQTDVGRASSAHTEKHPRHAQ